MKMLELKIQDRKYGMRKMPPLQGAAFGLKVATLLGKLAANPGAGNALEKIKKDFLGKDQAVQMSQSDVMTTGAALIGILAGIDATEIMSVFKEAFSYEVYFEDKKLSDEINFDMHFGQFKGDLYVVAIWATYNHVIDFFSGLGDGLKALMPSSKTSLPDQV